MRRARTVRSSGVATQSAPWAPSLPPSLGPSLSLDERASFHLKLSIHADNGSGVRGRRDFDLELVLAFGHLVGDGLWQGDLHGSLHDGALVVIAKVDVGVEESDESLLYLDADVRLVHGDRWRVPRVEKRVRQRAQRSAGRAQVGARTRRGEGSTYKILR